MQKADNDSFKWEEFITLINENNSITKSYTKLRKQTIEEIRILRNLSKETKLDYKRNSLSKQLNFINNSMESIRKENFEFNRKKINELISKPKIKFTQIPKFLFKRGTLQNIESIRDLTSSSCKNDCNQLKHFMMKRLIRQPEILILPKSLRINGCKSSLCKNYESPEGIYNKTRNKNMELKCNSKQVKITIDLSTVNKIIQQN